jgi:hypothetical protein
MTIDLNVLAADETAITVELPANLEFMDQTVQGMSGEENKGQELTEEGFRETITIEFRALVSLFKTGPVTAPFANQSFTHKESGKRYRIMNVKKDYPTSLAYILTCVELMR